MPSWDTSQTQNVKKKKKSIHVKQPTQSVPQSQVLSIKTALNAQAVWNMGIVLYQHSSAVLFSLPL